MAPQVPAAAFTWVLEGQVKVGFSRSLTTTRNVQVRVRPAPSVTFHCTVVIPFGNVAVWLLPLAAGALPPLTQAGWPVGKVQLSDAAGVV